MKMASLKSYILEQIPIFVTFNWVNYTSCNQHNINVNVMVIYMNYIKNNAAF